MICGSPKRSGLEAFAPRIAASPYWHDNNDVYLSSATLPLASGVRQKMCPPVLHDVEAATEPDAVKAFHVLQRLDQAAGAPRA